jgi:hypothetical protein
MEPELVAELIRLAEKFTAEEPGPLSELFHAWVLATISNADQMRENSRRLERIERVLIAAAQDADTSLAGQAAYRSVDLDLEGVRWTAVVRDGQPADVIELGRALKRALENEGQAASD